MALILTEEEQMLKDSVSGFFAQKAPVTALRALRDRNSADGFDRSLWQEMAQMGYAGVIIPEDYDGAAMGYVAAGLIAEAMGRHLSASPFFSTSILAARLLLLSDKSDQICALLKKIAHGQVIIALAIDEAARHNPAICETRAERNGNGFIIRGQKQAVIDGHIADYLIVPARTDEGMGLFLVDSDKKNVTIERTHMVDSRNSAKVILNGAELTADALIGRLGEGETILSQTLQTGRAILAAELLGAGEQAFLITTEYIKERKQFGQTIGSFQALQHRASHLYTEMELSRSAVLAALTALDQGDPMAGSYCAMAKAKLGETAKLSALEGVQMHGGVGMTDEYDIGLYLKRIRVAQELLGDSHFQLESLATAAGY